ncbi:MAG TPA: hypothetical protein VD927_01460 [Chryseosolibacter sp.]|nr:hypothetical protein [Chryseosolibacter sp.]
MKKVSVLLFLFTLTLQLFAQDDKAQEFLRQEEQRRKAVLMRELDSGIYFMDIGKYDFADRKFRHVLSNIKTVPSDLTFFFGKNSFHLQQYKQSVDWLTKYIQLKGTSGQFSEEAAVWLRKSEQALVNERNAESEKAEQVLSKTYDIDCGPSGKVSCPVCKGDHVIIKKGAFGDEYRTCLYCNEHGMLTCEEYNKLLRGELESKN